MSSSLSSEYDLLSGPDNEFQPIRIAWSIKGYHVFRLRPHENIQLRVEKDNGNQYDPYAMKVMAPTLDVIPHHMHDAMTRPGPVPQRVRDIAGEPNLIIVIMLMYRV